MVGEILFNIVGYVAILCMLAIGLQLVSGLLGIINIIFGLLLLGNTLIAAATLPWVLGIFAIVGGIATVVMAFRLRTT